MSEPFPDEIADAKWIEAHRRADAIRRFLRNRPDSRRVSDVLDLACELGVSKATAYRLVKAFRAGGTVMSLVDRKRGRPKVTACWTTCGRRSSEPPSMQSS